MDKQYKPTNVTVYQSDQLLTIEWADGHTSEYPLEGLRKNCPCVICKGGHAHMGKPGDRSLFFEEPEREWEIKNIDQIGNHAIRIHWDDGHSNGMYRWDSLRDMCPCEECYPEQGDGE